MNDKSQKHPNALKRVVYEIPGMAMARVQRDVEYHRSADHRLTFDFYRADEQESPSPLPIVLFVAGFPDVGVRTPLGCCFKEVEMMVSAADARLHAFTPNVAWTRGHASTCDSCDASRLAAEPDDRRGDADRHAGADHSERSTPHVPTNTRWRRSQRQPDPDLDGA
jgi:hypothetical protein